ncbi:MAG: hypothetical protein ACEPOZ_08580 [Marinifilaceae bacterium]
MLGDKSHIDKLFSDGLTNFEKSPDAIVWDRINQEMSQQKRKKRVVYYFSLAASVALLLAFGAGYFLSDTKIPSVEEQVADLKPSFVQPLEKKNPMPSSNYGNSSQPYKMQSSSLSAPQKTIVKVVPNLSSREKEEKGEVKSSKWLPSFSGQMGLSPLLIRSKKGTDDFMRLEGSQEMHDNQRIRFNQMLLAQNVEQPKEKRKLSLMGQVSPSFAGYDGGGESNPMERSVNSYGTATNSEGEKGLWSVGGGVKINIPTGKRLSFQTGVFYNRIGQKSFQNGGVALAYGAEKFSAPTVALGTSSIRTSAGYVKVKRSEAAPMSARVAENVASNIDPVAMGGELKQYFETIELPLLMKYNLINRKVSFHLLGGVSTNLIVGNKVYMNSGSGDQYIGETAEIHRTNFSTNLGFGVEYGLTSRIRISVEPSFKYYLNSISKNSSFNYRPYSLGIYTGLSFQF